MLKQRILSAFFMLVLFLLFNFGANDFLFALIISVMAGLSAWEWTRISGIRDLGAQKIVALLVALFCFALLLLVPVGTFGRWLSLSALLFWIAVPMLFYIQPLRIKTREGVDFRQLLIGVYLISSCAFFLHNLHSQNKIGSEWICLYALAIAWVMDIGAYFSGKRWGQRKLAPIISPGKTWEGAAGGFLLTLFFLALTLMTSHEARSRIVAVLLGTVLAALASVVGDLYESRLKRAANMKDSSQLIPGHGGILDRIDGQLASIPVFAFAWIWL